MRVAGASTFLVFNYFPHFCLKCRYITLDYLLARSARLIGSILVNHARFSRFNNDCIRFQ